MLNVVLFGQTAQEWRNQNRGKSGNMRDYATINQLLVLANMLVIGKLNAHLEEIDRAANELFDLLVKQYAAREGVTEQLKAVNQMEWVRRMNSIRDRVKGIICSELIYD